MGLGKNWTKEEEERLAEEWGMYSVDTIAKHLSRSHNAILIKVSRLGLGSHLSNSSMVTLNQLLDALGLHGGYTERSRKFKAAGLKIHKQRVKDCSFRMVDLEEFWEWAEKNKQLIDFSRFEENALGAEPSWVKVKRAEDFKRGRMVKPRNAKWTEAEERELIRLLRTYRYGWAEIAQKLHRSEGAIQRRIQDLGLKERPLREDPHSVWTDQQLATVHEMILAGSNYENMSLAIGKSVKAIRGKMFALYGTEKLVKVSQMIGA